MKRYLSLLLTMVIAMSCVSFAAPVPVAAVETVTETETQAVPEENVPQAEVMAEQPSNVLFYEDFEGFELKRIYTLTPSYRKDGVTATVATTWNGVAEANWNIIEENGDKVLHINQANGTANNVGFDIQNLNIADPGVYTLSYQFKQVLGENATGVDAPLWGGSGSSGWFQYALYDRAAGTAVAFSPEIPAIPTKYATDNMGKWYDVEYQYIVKDTGNGTRSFLAKNSLNGWVGTASTIPANHQLSRIRHYHFFQPNNSATVGNLYIDNFKLTYGKYLTIKYVDENGNTVKSAETYQGAKVILPDKAALGTSYTPAYSMGGAYFSVGDTVEIPADAAGEYVVTVTRFPVNAPENAVLYEDYQSRTAGTAAMTEFAYSTEAFSGVKIGLGDAGYASSRTDLFAAAPDSTSNKTLKVENAKTAYAPGFHIENLSFANVGKYNISYRLYTDATYENHPTIYYYARLDNNELKRWVYPTLGAQQRNTWVDVSYDIEVYEENGVKKIKYDTDKVMDCPEVSTIKFYVQIDGLSVTQTANVWFDDVTVTHEGFGVMSFVDEDGEKLAFEEAITAASGTYKLPSAQDLSLDYNIEFTAPDGKTYYPGMSYKFGGRNEYVFTVKKSNVIFFESYDNKVKASSDVAAEYTAGPMKGDMTNTSYVSDADANGNKTSVLTSTGNTAGQKDIYLFTGLNIKDAGLYKFSADVKLIVSGNKTDADKGVDFRFYSASSWSPIHNIVTLEDGKTVTVDGYIEVFEQADGTLAFTMPTRTDAETLFPISTGINNVWGRVMFNKIDASSTAEYTVTIDNLKVEYTDKSLLTPISYKENSIRVSDPAGIRFKSSVTNTVRENKSLTEYGFIVTRQVILDKLGVNSNDFTMDNSAMSEGTYVKGVSYGTDNGKAVDRIFGTEGENVFFTAAVHNIPVNHYKDVIVVRPFVMTGERVVYGEPMSSSIYAVAERIASSSDNAAYKTIADKILKGEEI